MGFPWRITELPATLSPRSDAVKAYSELLTGLIVLSKVVTTTKETFGGEGIGGEERAGSAN